MLLGLALERLPPQELVPLPLLLLVQPHAVSPALRGEFRLFDSPNGLILSNSIGILPPPLVGLRALT